MTTSAMKTHARSARILCGLLAVGLIGLRPAAGADTGKRPNILFIIVDDQSPFGLRAYNPKSELQTPTIDRLAAEGIVLDGAWQSPPISPTSFSSSPTIRATAISARMAIR